MGDLRTPRLNMRDQKLKMGDFRRPRPKVGDQKSPELPLDLTVGIHMCRCNYKFKMAYLICAGLAEKASTRAQAVLNSANSTNAWFFCLSNNTLDTFKKRAREREREGGGKEDKQKRRMKGTEGVYRDTLSK